MHKAHFFVITWPVSSLSLHVQLQSPFCRYTKIYKGGESLCDNLPSFLSMRSFHFGEIYKASFSPSRDSGRRPLWEHCKLVHHCTSLNIALHIPLWAELRAHHGLLSLIVSRALERGVVVRSALTLYFYPLS